MDALTRVLEVEDFDGMIIFVRTKSSTVDIADRLQARGFSSAALNGDLSHTQNLLIKSARILDITTQNRDAADSTLHEKNFAEKIAALMQNQLHASTHANKKE